jgi:creatinine amidohydrolase
MSLDWMRLTAEELRARAAEDALVIIPVASLEQHGPHLGTGVDVVCATGVAEAVARRLTEAGEKVVVTPCVWTGLAEHHMSFGGTVSLEFDEFRAVLRGIVRSAARCGFKRVMLLNGHGGNAEAVGVCAMEFQRDFAIRCAAGTYWFLTGDGFTPVLERQASVMHACEAETSMVMALAPDLLRPDRLAEAHGPHSTRVEGQPPSLLMRRSFKEISPSGVIGDARPASAEKGRKLIGIAAERIAEMLRNPKLWA